MNVHGNVPNVRYEWQRTYLAAALETDSRLLPRKIIEARREIRRRLFDCAQVDADEQSAVADALNALVALERERLHPNLDCDKHSTIVLDLTDAAGTTH
jgi:hypothetical protein